MKSHQYATCGCCQALLRKLAVDEITPTRQALGVVKSLRDEILLSQGLR